MTRLKWSGWDPFGGLKLMQREMQRLVDRTFTGESRYVGGGMYPPVNVYEGQDDTLVQIELPGVAEDEIDLSITGETLTIKGKKNFVGDEDQDRRYQRRERWAGEFSRTIVLPEKVEADEVEAKLTDGVLTVRLPRAEAAKPKKIAVQL
ncbi:MAG: Hsp20/alpha crystallin family protein [Phycisphaerae bacterium]